MSRDGRRPDGVTMIPWASGRCLAWDATVADTLAPLHLPSTAALAGAAAEHAARSKHAKYAAISATHTFVPLAFETLRPICDEGCEFLRSLGRRITDKSGDARETQFLFQWLSIAVPRGNAASIRATNGEVPATT